MKRLNFLVIAVACFLLLCGGGAAFAETETVDCDDGDTISEAFDEADVDEVLRIEFSGTCTEDVVVDHPNVTIVGLEPNRASTVMGGISVSTDRGDVRHAVLQNFTVIDTQVQPVEDSFGILISATNVTLQDISVDGAAFFGIWLRRSASVTMVDCTIGNSGRHGILVTDSTLLLGGTIESHDNAGWGIIVSQGGQLLGIPQQQSRANAASIEVHHNLGGGVGVFLGSSFFIPNAPGATLWSHDNSPDPGGAGGLQVDSNSTMILDVPTLVENNDGYGVLVGLHASFKVSQGLTSSGNTSPFPGFADDFFVFSGLAFFTSDVTMGNIGLLFGARMDFRSGTHTVGPIFSDGTAICLGNPACP